MVLTVFGINHRTSTLAEREPFQISRRELGEAVLQYKRLTGVDEVAIVATCNRIEFYRAHSSKGRHGQEVVEFYCARGVDEPERILDLSYRHVGAGAARHLFRVISGMDSIILGEEQIRGQVKDAYSQTCAFGGAGKAIHKLFHHAFRVSKRIRSETTLGTGARGLPGAAVELLVNSSPNPQRALVIGADETTETVLNHLRRKNIHTILINRTEYAAQKLAQSYGADYSPWNQLRDQVAAADMIFSATGAREAILTNDLFNTGRTKEQWIADLAIPRDVDPAVSTLGDHIHVIDLQDLKYHLEQVAERRCEALPAAQALIEEQVDEYLEWLHCQEFVGGIDSLKQELHESANSELQRFKGSFHKSEIKALEAFSHSLIKRFLKIARHNFDPQGTMTEAAVLRHDPAAVEEQDEMKQDGGAHEKAS